MISFHPAIPGTSSVRVQRPNAKLAL